MELDSRLSMLYKNKNKFENKTLFYFILFLLYFHHRKREIASLGADPDPVNLENTTMLHLLFDSVKRKTQFILEEFLFTEKPIVKNEDNDFFTNQFVVSFYNEEKLKKAVNYAN